MRFDQSFEFAPESGLFLWRHSAFSGVNIRIHRGHILPNKDAKFVAPMIPALRLYFDMFTYHVETKVLGCCNVKTYRFVAGRSIDSVRPETLVERPYLK